MHLRERYFRTLWALAFGGCAVLLSYCSDLEEDPGPDPKPTDTLGTEIKAPKLVSHAYRYDSIKLIFDKAVKQIFIASDYDVVRQDQIKFDKERKEVAFPCSYCVWGQDYAFRFTVQGNRGPQAVDTADIGFYFKKIRLPGMVRKLYVDDNHEYFYLLTREPYRLSIFSASEQRVVQEIPLNFLDAGFSDDPKMSFNPRDGLIYFYSNAAPKIFGYSISSGTIEKTIVIKADPSFLTFYPYIFPYNVQFTSSGKAIAMMKADNGTDQRACILAPYKTDTLIAEMKDWHQAEFSLSPGRNHDIIYLCTDYLEPDRPYWRFHADGRIDSVQVPHTEGVYPYSDFIKPHQQNNLIYVAKLYEQFILNESTGQISEVSYLDGRGASSADFSYAEGEEALIYYCTDEYPSWHIHLMDYANGKTVFEYGILNGLRELYSTFDGNYLVMYKEENLYMFSVEKLRSNTFNL